MSTDDPITEGRQLIADAMAGPLTPEQYDRLDALLAAHPELRAEQRTQEEMDVVLATYAARHYPRPAEALAPSVLVAVLAALEEAREAAPVGPTGVKVIPFPATRRQTFHRWLAAAAAIVIAAGVWRMLQPSAPTVVVHAPDGFTTTPLLTWENSADPAQKYDVWILPAGADQAATPALFKIEDVRAPVLLTALTPASGGGRAELERGRKYEQLVCLANTDRMTGTMVSFTIAADAKALPATPAEAFLELQKLRAAKDDAGFRHLLQSLPPDWRHLPEIKALE